MKTLSTALSVIPCALFMSMVLASCSNDDYLGGHYTTDGAGSVLAVSSANTTWSAGDSIGISTSAGASDASSRNRLFIVQPDGKTLLPANGEQLYIKGNAAVLAYYRVSNTNDTTFVGMDGAEPLLKLNTTNQSNLVDYRLAKVEGVNPTNSQGVALNFQSGVLATLTFNIVTDGSDQISEWKVTGLAQTAIIEPYSFDIALDEYIDFADKGTNITAFSRKVIPQPVGEGQVKVILNGANRTYSVYMPATTIGNGANEVVTVRITDGKATVELGPKDSESPWDKDGETNITSGDAN